MKTSPQGIAQLEDDEGVVLRAYRDIAGVWTIGAGLTAASGVVVPRAGMVITDQEAHRLLQLALSKNYEPAVAVAMSTALGSSVTRPRQHEFDAGVLFHWNTGAIARASWVRAWKAGQPKAAIRAAMLLWNKAGGRVVRGLQLRRQREADMLLHGIYALRAGSLLPQKPGGNGLAVWTDNIDMTTREAATRTLVALGYAKPDGEVTAVGARKFQNDHGLTADGIIGRATVTTIQRRADAARKAVMTVPVTGSAAVMAAPASTMAPVFDTPWLDQLIGAALLVWVLWQAWHYRDAIAAKINPILPRLAAYLRSF